MLALFDPKKHPTARLTGALFLVGAAVLAVEPLLWLVRTWTEPAYDSPGGWIFLVAAGLFAWSATSPLAGERPSTRHALWLLGVTALVRLASQLLALNVLGALALVIDVYALSVLAGLGRRKRAVSPLWIAGLFAFSLPVERIFQRLIGYALQHVSAAGSCGILGMLFDDVACSGVEIVLAGKQVLVDLPCSGARGLVLLSVLFCGLAAVARPGVRQALAGLGLAVVSALVANSIRIAALAIGLAFPTTVGVDVMAAPWHDFIGLAALAFGLVPLVMWARMVRDTAPDHPTSPPRAGEVAAKRSGAVGGGDTNRPRPRAATTPTPSASALDDALRHLPHSGRSIRRPLGKLLAFVKPHKPLLLAALFCLAALAILLVPARPVDVARPIDGLDLPTTLAGHTANTQALSEREEDYFTRFGGGAAKASYGPHTLLAVQTSAPLRHLHAPDDCLSGAGYDVDMIGVAGRALPGATYLATAPSGQRWRVVVTYVSDRGHVATSISEVVWRWLQAPDSTWTALQRFHPLEVPDQQAEAFDAAVRRAFDVGQ